MNKKRSFLLLTVFALTLLSQVACSMNRQLPAAADEEAMGLEVKAAITAVAPGSGIKSDVTEGGHVTLSGHADSAAQRDAVVNRVKEVNGVTSVDASGIHVQ
jgi:hypothetical protein